MRPSDNIEKLLKKLCYKTSDETHDRIRDNILQALDKKQNQIPGATVPVLWRIIMKSTFTKMATAAVIIIVALICILQFGGSTPAFAEVVQPLLTARTVTYKITINIEGAPSQIRDCMLIEPGRMRQVLPSGVIQITDKLKGKEMDLYPAEKKAVIYEMTNMPEDKQGSNNWFQRIRECIRQAQQTEDESVTFLGKQKINGAKAFGYRIVKNTNLTDMTVWVDAEKLLPTWIEYSLAGAIPKVEGTIICSDIVFNKELDESSFNIQVPEGYESQTMQYDYEPRKRPGEEDLIQALTLWSDNTGGQFPSELNMNATVAINQLIKEKLGLKFEKGKAPDISNSNLHEFYRIRRRIQRGVGFVQYLPSESDWHYAGKDVKFGEAEKPICWYRPEDSETYRVIYGDLSIKDVTPEDLPQ